MTTGRPTRPDPSKQTNAARARKWGRWAIVMGWIDLIVGVFWLAAALWLMPPDWLNGHGWMAGVALIALGLAAFGSKWGVDHNLDERGL